MGVRAYTGLQGSGKSYMLVADGLERYVKSYRSVRLRYHDFLKAQRKYDYKNIVSNMPPRSSYKTLHANFDFDLEYVVRYLITFGQLHYKEAVVLASQIQTVKNIQDLINAVDSIVLFDEAHLWFHTRAYADLPPQVVAYWSQQRKGGADIIYATQKFEMLDTQLRNLTHEHFRARVMPFWWQAFRALRQKKRRLLPVFRYSLMSESTELYNPRKANLADSIANTQIRALDLRIASCYDTKGEFYLPDDRVKTKTELKAEENGLKFDWSKFQQSKRSESVNPFDSPPLSVKQLAYFYIENSSPAEYLSEVFMQDDKYKYGVFSVPSELVFKF